MFCCEVLAQIVISDLRFTVKLETVEERSCLFCHVRFSVHRSLAHVLLDWKLQNPRAVHSGLRPVCLLAVYPRCHCAAGLDAPGTHRHHAQSPGVDAYGGFL